jgi:hypothetical protein
MSDRRRRQHLRSTSASSPNPDSLHRHSDDPEPQAVSDVCLHGISSEMCEVREAVDLTSQLLYWLLPGALRHVVQVHMTG